jgi:Uma2 family endonuclease
MPKLLTKAEFPTAPERAPNAVRWTRKQADAVREAGILTQRYELIDGEILSKTGQTPRHTVGVVLLNTWLVSVFGGLFVQIQSTIDVADADPNHNEPEPDAAVTRAPGTTYADRHPGPDDLALVVEVSDSTLRFDRSVKALLYARAGISEYWVLDATGRQLFVHRAPSEAGYADVSVFSPAEAAAPLSRPEAAVQIADLLPPA